jgi:hypothetical protein
MGDAFFIRKSLFAIGGLLIWAAHFGLVYTFNALVCARQSASIRLWGVGLVPSVVTGLTLIALACALAILLLALWRKGPARFWQEDRQVDGFMRYTTIGIAALSLLAIAWSGVPALVVPPCA